MHGAPASGGVTQPPALFTSYELQDVVRVTNIQFTNTQDINLQQAVDVISTPGMPEVLHALHASDVNSSETIASPPLTTFDVNSGSAVSAAATFEPTQQVSNPEGDLGQFFERPVLINEFTWELAALTREVFNPLKLYLNNKYVVNRINNYSWMTGTMCIKFVINGTPYHYGKLVAAANHYRNRDNVVNSTIDQACSLGQLLTMNHVVLNPTESLGGCMEVPLYYPYNYIPLTDTGTLDDIVEIDVRALNPLSAITPTPQMDLTVEVWAWFKKIELVGPTHAPNAYLTPQAMEMDNFSSKASVLSKTVGTLSNTPVIGRYAQAASVATGAIASVASAFGFSRPSSDPENGRIINTPIGNLSNYNALDDGVKVALDARNAVTVDNTVTGHDAGDEMSFVDIAKKEFYTYTTMWAYGDTSPLAYVNVTPQQYKQVSASGVAFIPSPACHVSLPFKYWRGTMKIRFEVVASAFHQGKLRVVYDPTGKLGDSNLDWANEHNLNHSYIIDLSKEREYTMTVGWNSAFSYCRTYPLRVSGTNASGSSSSMDSHDIKLYNGRVGIHPITPLASISGPSTPSVYINIYTSMHDDFEVAVPICENIANDLVGSRTQFDEDDSLAFQSGPIVANPGGVPLGDGVSAEIQSLNKIGSDSDTKLDQLALVHLGERVRSVRAVTKRYSHSGAFAIRRLIEQVGAVAGNPYRMVLQYSNFPSYAGFTFSVNSLILQNVNESKINLVPNCNWLTWFTPCYLMRRGSIRNKYIWNYRTNGPYPMAISINNVVNSQGLILSATLNNYTATAFNTERLEAYQEPDCSFCGSDITDPNLRPTLAIESPNQVTAKWFFGQNRDLETVSADLNTGDFAGAHKIRANVFLTNATAVPCIIYRYTAAGDDFSLNCYKYAPLIVRATLY